MGQEVGAFIPQIAHVAAANDDRGKGLSVDDTKGCHFKRSHDRKENKGSLVIKKACPGTSASTNIVEDEIEDTLTRKVLSGKYFPYGDVWKENMSEMPSLIWRGIHRAKEKFQTRFFWRLGVDNMVPMFQTRWGGGRPVQLSATYFNVHDPVRYGEFMMP
ncbi:hypothetical protein V6N13_083523 [Hibiscus sabdariffa]